MYRLFNIFMYRLFSSTEFQQLLEVKREHCFQRLKDLKLHKKSAKGSVK